MIVVGLTGSIGMGKSTTAALFAERGVPVHSADEAVHRLYRGRAAPIVEGRFPGTTRDGVVDRALLAQEVLGNPEALRDLEALIHPLVREEEARFLHGARASHAEVALLDIPLLLESPRAAHVDRIVVVTAPAAVQRERVLARPGMSEEKFAAILGQQMPDAEKRKRADYLVDTSQGIEAAREAVDRILADLLGATETKQEQ